MACTVFNLDKNGLDLYFILLILKESKITGVANETLVSESPLLRGF